MASKTPRRQEAAALHGVSRKRKDVGEVDASRVPPTTKIEPAPPPAPSKKPAAGGGDNNRLLAGYLAHEFLTKGTLFGERWPPPAAAAPPPPVVRKAEQPPAPPEAQAGDPPAAYAEVAYLLKTDGAHIPGVVNPTQLARLLRGGMPSDRY